MADGYCWICDETYFDGYHDWEKHNLYLKRMKLRTTNKEDNQ
jgi:hypothetical protein